MIPSDEDYDVFVCDDVLVEVWHGKRISVAHQFGVDWNGPTHSALHESVFSVRGPLPWRVRLWFALKRREWLVWTVVSVVLAFIVFSLARGWW
jgi:hypothetical protein